MFLEYKSNKKDIKNLKELLNRNDIKESFINPNLEKNYEIINETIIKYNNTIDKDMIGLKYPEIYFDKIKENIMNNKLKSSLIRFLEDLEIKLKNLNNS